MAQLTLILPLVNGASYASAPWYNGVREALIVLALVSVLGAIAVGVRNFVSAKRREAAAAVPQRALALQARLGELADEVRRLEQTNSWARSHHLRAAEHAYDQSLAEACRMAGIVPEDERVLALTGKSPFTQPEVASRLSLELALAERGWSW